MSRETTGWLRSFLKSARGNVAMTFALALIPLTIGAGVGLDYARAMLVRQQMSEALDAAALAIGSSNGLTQDAAQAVAQKYFDANYTVDKTDYGTPVISIPSSGYNSKGSVTITATSSMPTVLVKLIGISSLPVTVSSNVIWGQTKLWVSLVLDNSNSMNDGDSSGTKLTALKTAANQLLTILQNASTNAGDSQVSIVPFGKGVLMGTANVGKSWIDWTNWECPPQKTNDYANCVDKLVSTSAVLNGHPLNTFGPGDSCPFDGTRGYICAQSPVNDPNCSAAGGSTCPTVLPVPASGTYAGYICPSMNSGTGQPSLAGHYYNGCWVPSGSTTLITTGTNASCTGYTSTACGCLYSSGSYGGTSAFFGIAAGTKVCIVQPAVLSTGSSATCAGHLTSSNCGCATSSATAFSGVGGPMFGLPGGTTMCLAKVWNLSWTVNAHSSWTGCVMDRDQNYDIANTTPTSTTARFPAENNLLCGTSAVTPLGYSWTNLTSQINAMTANGATNQAIGIVHGWQTMTQGDPYGASAVPDNTTRYMIILSDGLNSEDRWYYSDIDATGVDAREKSVCDAAKADGVIIYSIYINIGQSSGNSAPLQYCASDATKYFSLGTTGSVVTTFQQIAQQITNLRVVK